MADKINIYPDKVGERAEQFRTQAGSLNAIIQTMDNSISGLMDEWEGESSAAFMAKYQEIRPGFLQAEEMMREIASALDKNASRYEKADARMAKQFL